MYEKHFGLKSRPFRSGTDASGIFVGPAQAKIMANLKKALAASDAVVTVTGPVGIGKTTVVNRALEGIGSKKVIARVGRMQLAADEVLELLLTEFDVSRHPTGTIQRFAAFKRLLHDWAIGGTRAFIIVEDAERIGTDALIELEALTAGDGGDSAGASIILMGQPSLSDIIAAPALARVRQRIRLRQTAAPFSAQEVLGYLKHCIRAAGGEFDEIFDPGAVDMLYRCSEGVPRVLNHLCESVLAAAAEANAPLLMPQLVQYVAQEEFGVQPILPATVGKTRATNAASNAVSATARAEVSNTRAAAPVISEAKPEKSTATVAAASKPETGEVETAAPLAAGPKLNEAGPAVPATGKQVADEAGSAAPSAARPVTDEPKAAAAAANEPATDGKPAPAGVPGTDKPQPATAAAKPDRIAKVAQTIAELEPVPVAEFTAKPENSRVTVTGHAPPPPEETKSPVGQQEPAVTAAVADADLDEIPELIQDTQPGLAALAIEDDLPDLTDLVIPGTASASTKAASDSASRPDVTARNAVGNPAANGTAVPKPPIKGTAARPDKDPVLPTLDDIPTLSGDMRVEKRDRLAKPLRLPENVVAATHAPDKKPATAAPIATEDAVAKADSTITEIPAWDRDPTLAELRPDIAALEAALGALPEPPGTNTEKDLPAVAPAAAGAGKLKDVPKSFDLPEITLEKELQVKEIEAQELRRKSTGPDTHEAEYDAPVKRKHGFDLDRIAEELGKARSLEDVDDKSAETLFGEEMAAAVAEVAAMVAADAAADHPMEESAPAQAAIRSDSPAEKPQAGVAQGTPVPAAVSPGTPVEKDPAAVVHKATPKAPVTAPETLAAAPTAPDAFVAAPGVEITLQSDPDPVPPPSSGAAPEPIENQFGTSMTATLTALSASQVNAMKKAEDEEEEKAPRRLFGLFRGST